MNRRRFLPFAATVAALGLLVGACGSTSTDATTDNTDGGESTSPVIIATTSILGDITANVVGDLAEVEVLIPADTDPHDFEPSARQAERLRDADVIIANGLLLEEGLVDALASAEADGIPVVEVGEATDPLAFGGDEHADDEHAGEEKTGDEHAGEEKTGDEHGHGEFDPHFWMDPARVAIAADVIADAVVADAGLDADTVAANTAAFVTEVEAVDAELEAAFATLAPDQRRLVTNHEALGYLADRYDLEIVGTVIPAGSMLAEPSAAALNELAGTMREENVRVIFTENTAPTDLAETLAAEVGGEVVVVELFTDSVGPEGSGGATWAEMMRTNAQRITEALRR
jgi:zinc/manganese transport system substrate-binding protein